MLTVLILLAIFALLFGLRTLRVLALLFVLFVLYQVGEAEKGKIPVSQTRAVERVPCVSDSIRVRCS